MNIIFKVRGKEYQLRGMKYDFVLNEYRGQVPEMRKGEPTGKMRDDVSFIGNYANPFRALMDLTNHIPMNDESITSFMELREAYEEIISDIRGIIKQYHLHL